MAVSLRSFCICGLARDPHRQGAVDTAGRANVGHARKKFVLREMRRLFTLRFFDGRRDSSSNRIAPHGAATSMSASEGFHPKSRWRFSRVRSEFTRHAHAAWRVPHVAMPDADDLA